MQFFGAIARFFKRIAAIGKMIKDKNVSLWKKVLVVFGIAYFVIPFEFLPDFLLPFGFIDDIILWVCIYNLLKDTLDQYIGRGKSDFSKQFKGKDVIDAEYKVKE